MTDPSAGLAGELAEWPSIHQMTKLLRASGLEIVVGQYSVRVQDCDHFVFQEYGGDYWPPVIDADADTVEEMIRDAKLVSNALTNAGIRHRFEVYNSEDVLVGYIHHEWPLEDAVPDI
ncbi:MAG: hypothetical protein KDA93_00395 [Planctomycetaceae bacterium]|nr:hypothetical protein [Planctomycetaceae bacterium]